MCDRSEPTSAHEEFTRNIRHGGVIVLNGEILKTSNIENSIQLGHTSHKPFLEHPRFASTHTLPCDFLSRGQPADDNLGCSDRIPNSLEVQGTLQSFRH